MADFSKLDSMSEAEERRFITAFTNDLANDKGEEAKRHLAAGRAIYYGDDRHPDGVVKEYPDGRRQLVTFQNDTEVLIRDL
ncbi:conserved protein of unknown function [Magnetospirillum gryphiswaldense MSR-1 v2]|uniref:Uncharacterized protein n=2 Tax=Magnetospirillum gryphiswaldense TaxID=55518 RepID=V6F171_MAGGM|nr:hypothetical protein [Magnetospirillum gryphiswaldense]CAM74280.1 hypothetical protein MGR_2035 [Magnetospirillum gryphiswaldense MSR-1]CDK99137.1 conserved protein of unknown function [Magnetospirillum gryphiswaldense MSR-1 v2]